MMTVKNITGKKVAILATDGFEQSELFEPRKALLEAGAEVDVVSLEQGDITGWQGKNWGDSIKVDKTLDEVKPEQYHALMLPGGLINPDLLRVNEQAVQFVKGFFAGDKQKPVGAICHGPWLLAEADVVKDRKVTSYASIQTDLKNAGANWTDAEVVVDKGLVTSRKPDDLNAFNRKLVEEIAEGQHKAA
ncbi:type 1 glutamine amidotransferase (plasmid) [Catenovulum adriaticum]|uniref:Type 1 glutamine amidotransferase n=2 Tax=Catenovulum adriaticum TaxID=2984846 RepID=A0ABY7AVN7_9ALTE|nr:type 1 glutamine amidotransferase domain-containing protein [Catenovulum sp. TS8]WAJ72296.1 type 1 glutamine amidotransferase [Catenovulum sp. TS8]